MSQARYSIMPSRVFSDPKITPTDIKVLGIIGCYLDKNNEAWPDQRTIAGELGISRETVNRALKRLAKEKYVTKYARRRKNGQQGTSKYLVHLEPVDLPQDVVRVEDDDHNDEGDRSQKPCDPPSDDDVTRLDDRVTIDGSPCDPCDHTIEELPTEELPTSPVSNETASGDLFEEEESSTPDDDPGNSDQRPKNADSPPTGDELLKSVIFTVGVRLLEGQGLQQGSARAFLGGLVKKSSARIVADAVNAACAEAPVDARGWLRKAVEVRAVRAGLTDAADASPEGRAAAAEARLADLDRRFATLARRGSWQAAWGHDPRIADEGYPPELYKKHGIERPGNSSRRRA